MKIRKLAAVSAMVIAAVGVTAGTATAAPVATPGTGVQTDIAPGINYKASIVDKSVVVTTDAGSLTTKDGLFQILDNSGKMVAGFPLTYQKDGKEFPMAAKVNGRTATITPNQNPAAGVVKADLKPVDATADFNSALAVAATQIGLAMSIGALVGTVVGAVVGCIGGFLLLVGIAPVFLPGPIGGCLAGIGIGATIGIAVGTIAFGVPVAIASGIQFYNTLYGPK